MGYISPVTHKPMRMKMGECYEISADEATDDVRLRLVEMVIT